MRSIFKSSEIKQKYELLDVLGDGNFAEVRLAINKESKERVAVKIIEPKDKVDEKMVKNEIEILGELDHPNIIRLIEVFDQPAKVLKARRTYIVMELVSGGEMLERIYQKKKFTEREAKSGIKLALDVLQYAHSRGIVHRDLKPGNILFVNERDDSPVKIADWGCAAKIPDMRNPRQGLLEVCGTPVFVSPEILQRNERGYGAPTDIWSLGIILYILLCGFPPFEHEEEDGLFRIIMTGQFDFPSPHWDKVSEQAKDLIRKMLTVDPYKRITAPEALKHAWIMAPDDPIDAHRIRLSQYRQYMCQRRFKRLTNTLIAVQRFQDLKSS